MTEEIQEQSGTVRINDEIKREKRFVAVMAHPRSGTGYMSKLFAAFGLDVRHETEMGDDGISSFLIGASENPRWGPDPWKYDFQNRIHLVRDPVKVLSSVLACVTEGVQEYMAREAGVDAELCAPERAVRVYIRWHERILCRKPNIRLKVEDSIAHLTEWLQTEPDPDKLPPTDFNNRSYQLGGREAPPDFEWSWWGQNVPLDVFYQFQALALEYGYDVPGVVRCPDVMSV